MTCSVFKKKSIISEESLNAVQEIVFALRRSNQVLRQGWEFGANGAHQGVVMEILSTIEKGSVRQVGAFLDAGWRMEAARALYLFITNLKMPLIPFNIQSIVLDNSNINIPPEVVANDVLGLIKQELPPKHVKLIALILYLLDCSMKMSPGDELRGQTLPIAIMSVFFHTENNQMLREWRRIVAIFVEFIRQGAPILELIVPAPWSSTRW